MNRPALSIWHLLCKCNVSFSGDDIRSEFFITFPGSGDADRPAEEAGPYDLRKNRSGHDILGETTIGKGSARNLNTFVYHSVNSGVYLTGGVSGVWVDGLFESGVSFSNMPPELVRQMEDGTGVFRRVGAMLFTHRHPDHYSARLVTRFARLHPETEIRDIPDTALSRFSAGGTEVFSFPGVHDGPQYRDVAHRCLAVRIGKEMFFFSGDASFEEELPKELLGFADGCRTYLFVNVLQARSAALSRLTEYIHPGRIFLIHLPFPEDDVRRYTRMAESAVRRRGEERPPLEMLPHMSWVDGREPEREGKKDSCC